jgi:hypothetical protein
MSLMNIRLELGRVRDFPEGDPRHGYEFVAPLDRHGHLDAAAWGVEKQRCQVRSFRPGQPERKGLLRHVGRGWRFDYLPGSKEDDEPFFKLDRHVLAPGFYVTIAEDDGVQRPFKIVSVTPARVPA